jgi:MFS family permease
MAPLDFNSVAYFIPMMSQLGVPIASIFTGQLSDKLGRKNTMLLSMALAGVGSMAQYFLCKMFWVAGVSVLPTF